MLKKLTSWWPVAIILLVEIILFIANYQPGTYLLGWDNIMPEFNLSANFERNVHGVWADYRGLGVLDGLAHTANIVHTVIIAIFTALFPLSFVRWLFIFLMHVVGGIGMYKLMTNDELRITNKKNGKLFALLGALFYQYNLATVQMFFAPLEVFVIHFAALPWLTGALVNFLEHPSKKHLVIFSILTLLFTPQAFVPSVWIAYMMLVGAIIMAYLIAHGKKRVKSAIQLLALIGLLNAFWLLPYAYSALTNAPVIAQTKINIMSNEDIVLKQKEFADFGSAALFHGFSLNQTDYFQNAGKFEYMMEPWRSHINHGYMQIISWGFFLLSVIGLGYSIIKKNLRILPFSTVYVVAFSLLATDVPILSGIPFLLNTVIPYFEVIFRFAYTKFVFVYALTYTILLVVGLQFLLNKLRNYLAHVAVVIALLVGVGLYTLPSFSGNFIYENMKVSLPQDYHDLFDYFKQRPADERIAVLPAHQYWSWQFYDFGARGSGFLWYGLQQPTMDRAFDPWSRENENFYWELSQAIYAENANQFNNVFQKHRVSWILLDNHIISPENPRALYTGRIRQLIAQNPSIIPYRTFGNLELFAVSISPSIGSHVHITDAVSVGPSYSWGNNDTAYAQYNTYYTDESPNVIMPFRDLFSGRRVSEGSYHITEDATSIFVTAPGSENMLDQSMVLAPNDRSAAFVDVITPYTTDDNIQPRMVSQEPTAVQVPKIESDLTKEYLVKDLPNIIDAGSCDLFRSGTIDRYVTPEGAVRFSSENSSNCYTVDMPHLPHRISYIIAIESRWEEGKPIRIGLINATSGKIDIDVHLPKSDEFVTSYIVVPPMDQFGVGYKIYIDNVSIGDMRTVNDLREIRLYPFPYEFISSTAFIKNNIIKRTPILIHSQSYSQAWHAYEVDSALDNLFPILFADQLTGHVLVNNWANGWKLDSPTNDTANVKIIYLPQYLQHLGFVLFGVGVVYVLLYRRKG